MSVTALHDEVYADFKDLADELLGQYGQRCIWRQYIRTTNVAKPWLEDEVQTAVDHEVTIFFTPTAASTYRSASGGEGYADQLLDRETESSKRLGIMPAPTGFVPNLQDTVYLPDGTVLRPRVFDLIDMQPGNPVLWKMSFDTGEIDPLAPTLPTSGDLLILDFSIPGNYHVATT